MDPMLHSAEWASLRIGCRGGHVFIQFEATALKECILLATLHVKVLEISHDLLSSEYEYG